MAQSRALKESERRRRKKGQRGKKTATRERTEERTVVESSHEKDLSRRMSEVHCGYPLRRKKARTFRSVFEREMM